MLQTRKQKRSCRCIAFLCVASFILVHATSDSNGMGGSIGGPRRNNHDNGYDSWASMAKMTIEGQSYDRQQQQPFQQRRRRQQQVQHLFQRPVSFGFRRRKNQRGVDDKVLHASAAEKSLSSPGSSSCKDVSNVNSSSAVADTAAVAAAAAASFNEIKENTHDNSFPTTNLSNRATSPASPTTRSLPTLLLSKLSSLKKVNPRKLARWSITGLQIGILIYLIHAVVSTVSDVMEEFSQQDMFGGGYESSYFCSRDMVPRILQYFEEVTEFQQWQKTTQMRQQQQRMASSSLNSTASEGTTTTMRPPIPPPLAPRAVLQLAHKLVGMGIPLRSSSPPSPMSSNSPQLPSTTTAAAGCASVESLLLQLTNAEANILQQCLWSPPPLSNHDDNNDVWDQIAGLQQVKDHLLSTIYSTLHPYTHNDNNQDPSSSPTLKNLYQQYSSLLLDMDDNPSSSSSSHRRQQIGILLYGPPGCGKTLLVKACATMLSNNNSMSSKVKIPCLVVTPSVLLRKYVGETNLLVRSLFSLANKLAPCIVCMDELDGLFRERNDMEHEVSRELKTEFLQWWDGMMTTSTTAADNNHHHTKDSRTPLPPIIVICATNRPFDVDSAVLRRLPQSHHVGLPDFEARLTAIETWLKHIPLSDDFDMPFIAEETEGYTPSDLRHLLKTAVWMGPLAGIATKKEEASSTTTSTAAAAAATITTQADDDTQESTSSSPSPSPSFSYLTTQHVLDALSHAKPTPLSPSYRWAMDKFVQQKSTHNGRSQHHGYQDYSSHRHHDHHYHQRYQQQQQPYEAQYRSFGTGYGGRYYHVGTLELGHQQNRYHNHDHHDHSHHQEYFHDESDTMDDDDYDHYHDYDEDDTFDDEDDVIDLDDESYLHHHYSDYDCDLDSEDL